MKPQLRQLLPPTVDQGAMRVGLYGRPVGAIMVILAAAACVRRASVCASSATIRTHVQNVSSSIRRTLRLWLAARPCEVAPEFGHGVPSRRGAIVALQLLGRHLAVDVRLRATKIAGVSLNRKHEASFSQHLFAACVWDCCTNLVGAQLLGQLSHKIWMLRCNILAL